MNVDRQVKGDVTKEQAWQELNSQYGEAFEILPTCYFEYWAYPQVFGSTSGPFRGKIGGQGMTTFTIEAWVVDNLAVLFCKGKIFKVTDQWKGPNTVRV